MSPPLLTRLRKLFKCPFSPKLYLLRAYLVIAAGCLVHLSLGTLYTFGNLGPYIVSYVRNQSHPADLHSVTTSWIYACALIGQGGAMFFGGWLASKIGPRLSTLIGSWTMSVGVALSYFAIRVSFWLLLLTYGIMFGVGVGIAYIGPLSCAMKWFPKWKGVVNGVVVSGFGLGALVFDAVQTSYINPDNLVTNIANPSDPKERYYTQQDLLDRVPTMFLILGATYATMQFIGCMFLVNPSEELQKQWLAQQSSSSSGELQDVASQSIDQSNISSSSQMRQVDSPSLTQESTNDQLSADEEMEMDPTTPLTGKKQPDQNKQESFKSSGDTWTSNVITSLKPLQMLKKLNFYVLWLIFFCNGIALTFVAVAYKFFGMSFIEDDHFLAVVGSTASVLNCLGRIVWGLLADQLSYKVALVTLSGTMTVLLLTFFTSVLGGKAMYLIWVCAIFFCIGGNFSLFPTAIGRCFGPKYVAVNYGLLFTSQMVSGPLVPVLSYAINSIQWYGLMFIMAGFSFGGFVLALLYRPKRYMLLGVGGR